MLQQQQQQKVLANQSKPSPPLANKRSTAIPRKPVVKNLAHLEEDLEHQQMNIPKSRSIGELASLSVHGDAVDAELSSNSDQLSPPPVITENQLEKNFSFSFANQQQVKCL